MTAVNELSPMARALHEAEAAAKRGEVPIGAVIAYDRRVIASAGNRTRELHDPTAHAEMLVLREACTKFQSQRIGDCDLYVTLEPCPMCAAAISFARIRRLYYAASDPKGGGVEHGPRVFSQATCNHSPELYTGVDEVRAANLMRSFFEVRRD